MASTDTLPIFRNEEELARLPASERIRYRLIGADCRYHANDNIAEFIQSDDREGIHLPSLHHIGMLIQK